MSLDDIFEPSEEVAEVEQTPEATTEPEKVEEETGQAEPEKEQEQQDTPEEPTSPKEDQKSTVPLAAVQDERRKRQELERKLEELQNSLQQKETDTVSVFDDEKAAFDSLRSEYRNELANAKLDMAREFMMESHEDYEEKELAFIELAKENPILRAKAQQAANPAKFAYEQAKKFEEWQKMQDVDKTKEALRAEIRAELEAELKSTEKKKADSVADITPSLAKARATDSDPKAEMHTLETLFAR